MSRPCNPHPDAPHGFVRNASHSTGEYVCECQGWEPPKVAWAEAQRVCDLPAVDEAIRAFVEDQTNDNAVSMVQAIMTAARGEPQC